VPTTTTAISPTNADHIVPLARWGRGEISSISWSPDGTILAIAASSGIYLHNARTLAEERWIETGSRVHDLMVDPGGDVLAAALADYTVRIWRISDGTLLHTLEAHTNEVNSVAFSPDGNYLASGSDDMTVNLWQMPHGKLLRTLEVPDSWDEVAGYTWMGNVSFSPDGTTLVAESRRSVPGADSYSLVLFWSMPEGKMRRTMEGVSNPVFAPDNRTIAAESGGKMALWSVTDGHILYVLEGDVQTTVSFSPDGQTIAAASTNQRVTLWARSNGEKQRTLEGPGGSIIAFSPDSEHIAVVAEGAVVLWEVATAEIQRMLVWDAAEGISVAYSPDGKTLATGSQVGNIHLRRVSDGIVTHELQGHKGKITSLAWSPDGQMLASGSVDKSVRLWNVADGSLLRTIEGHKDRVTSVAFSPDGTIIASGSWLYDMTIKLWNVEDGTIIRTLSGHTDRITDVTFSPDGAIIVSGSWDNTVRIWQTYDGMLLRTMRGHSDWIRSVAISPDGQKIASGSDDMTIKIWSVSNGSLLHTLEGNDWISSIAFSPDGETLACGSWLQEKAVSLWNVRDGTLLHTLRGHTARITSVAFSPTGTQLASGSDDGTVRLWGIIEQARLTPLLHTAEEH
jgi:WD40 repeat protein